MQTIVSMLSYISFVDVFNFCVFLTFTICYAYQLFYVLVEPVTDGADVQRVALQPVNGREMTLVGQLRGQTPEHLDDAQGRL